MVFIFYCLLDIRWQYIISENNNELIEHIWHNCNIFIDVSDMFVCVLHLMNEQILLSAGLPHMNISADLPFVAQQ